MPTAPTELVLLDAFGTLLEMEPPAPVLARALEDAGYPCDPTVVQAALVEEIAHYRAHMHLGCDAEGLAALRAACGGVLARALGPGAPAPALATQLLVDSLRFRLHGDALPAMDALAEMGVRLGVASNWDCALPQHLERLGVASRFDVIAASAAVGAAKPDSALFLHAAAAVGVPAARVLHVGDRWVEDYRGARAAGMRALLLDRHGGEQGPDVITTLMAVPERIAW